MGEMRLRGCRGGGNHGPCVPLSALGQFRINGRQLLPGIWLGHASPRLAACTNRVFVAELNLTSGQGDTPLAAQCPQPVQAGREGASSGVSHPAPLPLSCGLAPRRIAVPWVSLGPALVGCFPGQAWEEQVLPASQEGTGCSQSPRAVPGEGKGERDPTGTAAGGGRGQAAVSPVPYKASTALRRSLCRVAAEQEGALDGSPGLPGSQQLWGAT